MPRRADKKLTNDYQVHSHFNVAKSIDTFADINPGVILLSLLDPQLSSLGSDPDEGVVNGLSSFPPLYDGCRIAGDGTHNLDILSQSYNRLEILLLSYGGT